MFVILSFFNFNIINYSYNKLFTSFKIKFVFFENRNKIVFGGKNEKNIFWIIDVFCTY